MLFLLAISLNIVALESGCVEEQRRLKNGSVQVRVKNVNSFEVHCIIKGEGYFTDFYVSAKSRSRWNKQPEDPEYTITCKR